MANSTGQSPQIVTQTQNVGAVTIAADASTPAFRAPFAGTVSAVAYAAAAAITGGATNNRTFSLKNRKQDGLGTTVVATLLMGSGVNAVAFDDKAIPVSATPADLVVAEGDILSFESVHASSGIVDPGGLVSVTFARS